MMFMQLHLRYAAAALLALGLLGVGTPANADMRECFLLGMLGAALPAECTNADGAAPGEVLFGPALVNLDAEIHLVVRSHGPVGPLLDEGLLEEALATFGGGCIVRDEEGEIIPGTGPNECADVQFAVHRP